MTSLSLRDRALDRSLSVRFFDILVRSMVAVADAAASLVARLGYSDIGPLAVAVAPSVLVGAGREPSRPARRRGKLLPLELAGDLAAVQTTMPGRSASAA